MKIPRIPFRRVVGEFVLLAACGKGETIIAEWPRHRGSGRRQRLRPMARRASAGVTASKIYRCADSSVVQIDWLSDDKSANVRPHAGGTIVR